jgi:hypothetical protein
MATPRHKSAGSTEMKPPRQFLAIVYQQNPAINEVAQLEQVNVVSGTHEQCWLKAKTYTRHPVLEMKELDHVAKH